MRVREVILTKLNNVLDVNELKKHQNIKDLWLLPRDFVFFEFYHPAYELLNENDPEILKKAVEDPLSKQQMLEISKIKQGVLYPLCTKIKNSSDQLMLLVPTFATNYFFLGDKKDHMKWPDISEFVWSIKDWENANDVELKIKLKKTEPEFIKNLENIMGEWRVSAFQNGKILEMKPLAIEDFEMRLKCEFRNGCGDAIMALYMLLTDTQKNTTVHSLELVSGLLRK